MDILLSEGLASRKLSEAEFWASENEQTDGLLAEHRADVKRILEREATT